MVSASAKCTQGRKCWTAYSRPLRWLQNRLQDFRRSIQDNDLQEFRDTLDSLDDSPELFSSSSALAQGLQEVRIATGLLHEDFQAQKLNAELGITILDELLEQVGKIIETELAAEHRRDGQEWRDW
eukprot:8888229-Pyramimonas_sp.AAC.1